MDIDLEKKRISLDATYQEERDKMLLLWKARDIFKELTTVKNVLMDNGISLEQVTYTLRHKGKSLKYDVFPTQNAGEIPKETNFQKVLLLEFEWNREQVLKRNPHPDSVKSQCPSSLVAADISILAAQECVSIQPLGKWDSKATDSDKNNAARYYRDATAYLEKLTSLERPKYFWHCLMAFCGVAARDLLGETLSSLEKAFLADMLRIQKALDYLEKKGEREGVPSIGFTTLMRSGRTDFRPALFQNLIRMKTMKLSDNGYAHNECCLCTARALTVLSLWQEEDVSPRVLDWLLERKPQQWRAIDQVEGREPRLMSHAYTAATLDAMLDAGHEAHSDEIASHLLENHELWESDLERSLLDTKALILQSIHRYLQAHNMNIGIDKQEKLRSAIELFVSEMENNLNEQERIEGLRGTLFWREVKDLGWLDLAFHLESQAHDIRQAFSEDRIWDTEDGTWGYNDSRTGYLTHGWLSYWDYVCAGEDQHDENTA